MRVLAVDPGVTTGLALVDDSPTLRVVERVQLLSRSVGGAVRDLVRRGSRDGHRLVVVMEDYVGAGQRDRWSKETLLVIGRVLEAVESLGYEVHLQEPQRRLAFVEDAKALCGNPPHVERHGVDAAAHALRAFYDLEKGAKK